jgi:1-acyl-sn-glycerol-3-phosphate acyltransferase
VTYWVVKAVLTPVLRFFYRVRVEGIEHLPRRGPAILASNHVSFCDSFFLPMVVRRRITFVAKAEYFEDPKSAWFFRSVGQIPIKRSGGSASQGALDAATEVLRGGGLFGIYPEGTRSPDGRLYRGRTGVARPNVFTPVTVRIGRPLQFDRHERGDDPLVLRQVTDEVMFEIRALSGQDYVNHYAKRDDPEALPPPEPTPVLTGPPVATDGQAARTPVAV